MDFGCFVELQGVRGRHEGLVHVTNMASRRLNSAKDMVNRGDEVRLGDAPSAVAGVMCAPSAVVGVTGHCTNPSTITRISTCRARCLFPRHMHRPTCTHAESSHHHPTPHQVWVKVITMTGQRIGLSMRDVDQATGKDLLQHAAASAGARGPAAGTNPDAPAQQQRSALHGLSGIQVREDDRAPKRARKRLSSPERWELTQLVKTGVLDPSELPDFDEEEGGLRMMDAEVWVVCCDGGGVRMGVVCFDGGVL